MENVYLVKKKLSRKKPRIHLQKNIPKLFVRSYLWIFLFNLTIVIGIVGLEKRSYSFPSFVVCKTIGTLIYMYM